MPFWRSPWQTATRQAIYPSFPGLYLRDESAYYPSWLGSNVAGNKNKCGFYVALNLFHSKAKKCIFNSHSTCSSGYVGWLCFEYFIDFHGNAKDVIGIFCCFATDGFRMMEIFFNEGVAFQVVEDVGTCETKMSTTKMRFIVICHIQWLVEKEKLKLFLCRSRSTSTKYFTCQWN